MLSFPEDARSVEGAARPAAADARRRRRGRAGLPRPGRRRRGRHAAVRAGRPPRRSLTHVMPEFMATATAGAVRDRGGRGSSWRRSRCTTSTTLDRSIERRLLGSLRSTREAARFASRAVAAARRLGVRGTAVRRVEAVVRLENEQSSRLLERLGFRREGVKRRLLRYCGGWADATLFARLADRLMAKTLVVYLMAGRGTPALAEAAVEGGADLVELGFPFSDPLADGPVDPARGGARARRGDADAGVPRVPRRGAGARRRAARADDVLVAARGLRLGAVRRGRAGGGRDER